MWFFSALLDMFPYKPLFNRVNKRFADLILISQNAGYLFAFSHGDDYFPINFTVAIFLAANFSRPASRFHVMNVLQLRSRV